MVACVTRHINETFEITPVSGLYPIPYKLLTSRLCRISNSFPVDYLGKVVTILYQNHKIAKIILG